MSSHFWVRVTLAIGILSAGSATSIASPQSTTSRAAATTSPGIVDDLLHAAAAWSTPASILPLAYGGALAGRRQQLAQVAEAVVPAYRDAQGSDQNLSSLAMRMFTGQDAPTPDPLQRMHSTLSPVLGAMAALFTPPAAAGSGAGLSGFASELVDLGSGSLHLSYQDLSIPARGFSLALQRTFAPLRRVSSAMGNGWTFSYSTHLTFSESGAPVIQEADGTATHFALWQAPATYLAIDSPSRETLVLMQGGGATRLFVDGGEQQFDAQGRLLRLQSSSGDGLSLQYSGRDLVRVVDSTGRSLSLVHDANGWIRKVTDPLGATFEYRHDGAGNLIAATDPLKRVTRYHYINAAPQSYDVPLLRSINLPRGAAIAFTYDLAARVAGIAGPGTLHTTLSYDTAAVSGGTRTVLTDSLGARTIVDTTRPPSAANCAAVPDAAAPPAASCADSAAAAESLSTLTTDATGAASSVSRSAGAIVSRDADQQLSSITSDLSGRPVQVLTARGDDLSLTYDQSTALLTSIAGAGGARMDLGYDGTGALRTLRDKAGNITHIDTAGQDTYRLSGPGNRNASVQVDSSGLPVLLKDALGHQTQLTWDADGRLTRLDDPGKGTLGYRYDAAGQLTARTDAAGATTTYGYDQDGNLTVVRDAISKAWRFSYDTRDLPVSVTDPLGAVTRFAYDAAGRLISLTNALGHATTFRYDAAGHLVARVGPLNDATAYRYSPAGKLTEAGTPLGHRTQLRYDAAGRLATVIDPANARVSYTYDAAGRLASSRAGNGPETRYVYDANGRLIRRIAADGSGTRYVFDAAGNLIAASGAAGTLHFAYDSSGALTRATDAAGHVVRYSYDAAGRRSTMTGPLGAVTRYGYDALGHLQRISDPLGSASFTYDSRGLRAGATLPGGITARYDYDAIGRPLRMSYRRGGTLLTTFSYAYDAVGDVTLEQAGKTTRHFSYDRAGRLVTATGAIGTAATYTYDQDGNLVSSPLGSGWQYDAAGRLIQAGSVRFTYDAGGNLAASSDGTRYQFDTAGELRSLRGAKGEVSYGYDPLGRLVARTAGGKTTTTIYDGSDPITMIEQGGAMLQRLLYGPAIDEPLASLTGKTAITYLADRLGTVRMALNAAGATVLSQSFDAYGRLTKRQGAATTAPGYVGRPSDPASGLVNLRVRLYDPAHARFLSPDPAATPGEARYAYVSDAPLTFKDPLGLSLFGVSDGDISWGGAQAGTVGSGASILSGGGGFLGGLGNGLGYVGAASAIYNAMTNPSQSSAANAGIASAGAAIGAVCGPCAAPLFIGQTYGGALQNFIDAGNAFNTGGPNSPSGQNNGSDSSSGQGIGNLDPSFVQPGSAVGAASAASSKAWTMVPGTAQALSMVLPVASSGRATVTVYDAQGRQVRVLARARSVTSPLATVAWDGRNEFGRAVPAGRYFISMDLWPNADPAADLTSLRVVNVTRAAPAARSAAASTSSGDLTARMVVPADGSLVRGNVPIVGAAGGPDFDHYVVDYSMAGSPNNWIELASSTQAVLPAGPVSLPRETTLVGNLASLNAGLSNYHYDFDPRLKQHAAIDGPLTLRLRVFSRHGTVAEVRSHVIVGRVAPYVADSLVDSPDGRVTLSVPSMAIHADAQLFAVEGDAAPPAPPGYALVSRAYTVYPALYTFAVPASLRMTVPSHTAGAGIFAWNPTAQGWQPLPTSSAGGTALVASLGQTGAAGTLYAVLAPRGALPAPVLFVPGDASARAGLATIAGVAPAGTSVHLLHNGRSLGKAVQVGPDGAFSITAALSGSGDSRIQAVAADAKGRISAASNPVTLPAPGPQPALARLQAHNADFSTAAPITLGQGDVIGVEAQLAAGAKASDVVSVHVTSAASPAGMTMLLRKSGTAYRGLLAVAEASAANAWLGLPVIAVRSSDAIRISGGGRTLSLSYRDRTAPAAPAVISAALQGAVPSDLLQVGANWPAPTTPLGAVSSPLTDGGNGHRQALRIQAGRSGDLTTLLKVNTFDLRVHPRLSFSYNVPAATFVDLAIHANGVWWAFGLSDIPPTAVDTAGPLFAHVWNSQQQLVRDGRWHQISLDLYSLLRRSLPTGTITVDRIALGDWQPGGWMAIQPSQKNAPGASFLLDNLTLPAVTHAASLHASWSAHDPSGIRGYAAILDQKPDTVPSAQSDGPATQGAFAPSAGGTWWLHVRARDWAGNWSATTHYPIIVDSLAPQASAPSPNPGRTGDATVSVQLQDPGGSGIDPASLRFRAFGKTYGPESGAITFDAPSGQASLNLAVLRPAPAGLFPGGQVPVALVSAADVAGNTLKQPLAWTYTLDIPSSLPGGPQLLTRLGGAMPSLAPNSSRVAFISSRHAGTHLWTIDTADLAERQQTARQVISGSSTEADPAWSPDGRQIAVSSTRGGGRHIWLLAPDGSGLHPMTKGPGSDAHPTWSPDGRQLAFTRDGDLWVADRDGNNAHALLADGERAVREPAWSADSTHIAFRHSLYVDQIWLIGANGRHAAALTTLAQGEVQSSPTWLPDGRVAYISQRHNVSAIDAVNVDGTNQVPLQGQPPATLFAPNASRDGAATAFASTKTGSSNIWISRQFSVDQLDADPARLDAAAGHTVTVHWAISSRATVSISVTDGAGHIVRTLLPSQHRTAGKASTTWDGRDGKGQLVPEGLYSVQLTARAPGLPPLQRGVGVTIDNASLHGTLRVRVTRAGNVAGSVTLILSTSGKSGEFVTQAVTDASGTASLSLAAGRYDLTAQATDGATATLGGIVVQRHASLQRTLALAAPSGNSSATPSPTPIRGASATSTLTPAAAAGTTTPLPSATATPTPIATVAATAATGNGRATLDLSVVLAPGHPAANAEILVLQGKKVAASATSDAAGKTRLSVPSGQYTVQATLEGATGSIAVSLSAGNTSQVLDLHAGTLQLVVQQANGQPAAYASIYFLAGTKEFYDTGTNSEGQASAILSAGTYVIRAGLAPHDQTATAKVAAGATITLTIKLK